MFKVGGNLRRALRRYVDVAMGSRFFQMDFDGRHIDRNMRDDLMIESRDLDIYCIYLFIYILRIIYPALLEP